MSEFDKDTYEQIKLNVLDIKIRTFIANKTKNGMDTNVIKDKLILYLQDIDVDLVEDK